MEAAETSPPAPPHPCPLLRYVLVTCAGCLLRLCGNPFSARGDDDDGAGADPAPATAEEDQADGGGKTDEDLQVAQLLARRRRPQRPGNPREGKGGGGGSHN